MWFRLNKKQRATYQKSFEDMTKSFKLTFNKRQVQEASTTQFDGGLPFGLDKDQKLQLKNAKKNETPLTLGFSGLTFKKTGGIIPSLLYPLLASIPAALSNAEPLADGFKQGFKDFANLFKKQGSGVDCISNILEQEQLIKGSSLKIHGEGRKNHPVWFDLNASQLAIYKKSLLSKSPFSFKFTKQQVQTASTEPVDEWAPLILNPAQRRRYDLAKTANKGFAVSFTKQQLVRRGGLVPLLLPLLASLIPGIVGAAKPIEETLKSGFDNVSKILQGKGLTLHGGDLDSLDAFVGSSLKIHGQGLNGLQPAPHEVTY